MKAEKNDANLYMPPMSTAEFIYNSQDMATTQVSVNRWMDKEDAL